MHPDDDARPLTPRERRSLDALACRLDHDTPDPAARRRTAVGIGFSTICVAVAALAMLTGLAVALGLGVLALGGLLVVARVPRRRRRNPTGGPDRRAEG